MSFESKSLYKAFIILIALSFVLISCPRAKGSKEPQETIPEFFIAGLGYDNPAHTPLATGVKPMTKEELIAEIAKATDNWSESYAKVDLSYIDTSNIKDMSNLFARPGDRDWNPHYRDKEERYNYNKFFDGNISSWDTSNVTNMSEMFSNAKSFNQNLSSWNVQNVTKYEDFDWGASSWNRGEWRPKFNFVGKSALIEKIRLATHDWDPAYANTDLNGVDTSDITDMSSLFSGRGDHKRARFNEVFNGKIDKWDTSNVTNMDGMFSFAARFNQDISKWDTSNVTNMAEMFFAALRFNQNLSSWNVQNVVQHEDFDLETFSWVEGDGANPKPKFNP